MGLFPCSECGMSASRLSFYPYHSPVVVRITIPACASPSYLNLSSPWKESLGRVRKATEFVEPLLNLSCFFPCLRCGISVTRLYSHRYHSFLPVRITALFPLVSQLCSCPYYGLIVIRVIAYRLSSSSRLHCRPHHYVLLVPIIA